LTLGITSGMLALRTAVVRTGKSLKVSLTVHFVGP
jgi:hypothetical protein